MNVEIRNALTGQEYDLSELRARAMKESLIKVGRYNEITVRKRLLESYNQESTFVIYSDDVLVGFYTVIIDGYLCNLLHLYIDPVYQGNSIGTMVLKNIISDAKGFTIRLKALTQSKSNEFYIRNGFVMYATEEYDNCYERFCE